MEFEWDDEKRLLNLERHRLDFVNARRLFDGRPTFAFSSPRGTEERVVTVGQIGDAFLAVVWVQRGENKRLISFRRARDGEKKRYHAHERR